MWYFKFFRFFNNMYDLLFSTIYNVKINNNDHDHIHHRHENDFSKGNLIHFYENHLINNFVYSNN